MKLRQFSLLQLLLVVLALSGNLMTFIADDATRLALLPHLLLANSVVLLLLTAITRQHLLAPLRDITTQAEAANRNAQGQPLVERRINDRIELCETVFVSAVLQRLTAPSSQDLPQRPKGQD